MAIQPSQLILIQAERNDDTPNNGGRSTLNQIYNGFRNGIFSDLQSGASLGGDTETRKVFIKQDLTTLTASPYSDAFVFMKDTGADDVFIDLTYGTATDTQATAFFNSAVVGRVVNVDAVNLKVTIKSLISRSVTADIIRYRKSNDTSLKVLGADIVSISATETEVRGINPSDFKVGDIITEINYATGDKLNAQDLQPSVHDVQVTSGGTLDKNLMEFSPRAAINMAVELTFVNLQSYNYSIPSLGLTGSGNIANDLTIYHPDSITNPPSDILLKIPAAAFSGTWSNASRVTILIESGAVPLWIRRTIGQNPTLSGLQDLDFSLEYQTN
ncbi:hypothetical protein NVP1215B_080 [Vibrio phage 1.215.B._10N.222.54.F7]|nr:hypothetical protein NVP1215A_080 [Vibrio phage 1.215.A._10N.222.54.F7]AUR96103.1 hypothetical protein NVP1215B_080 [Vibrio phage 1.215.B._10N.222.54.F7]